MARIKGMEVFNRLRKQFIKYDPLIIDEWLEQIPVAIAAEAITDRLYVQAYKIVIKGKKSMRETVRA